MATETEQGGKAILYGPPFDATSGDLAVRASDNVFFLIPRLLLEFACPSALANIAALKPCGSDHSLISIIGERPVLAVSHPSHIVAHLLSTILPVSSWDLHLPRTFEDTALVLAAAKELGITRCVDIIRRTLLPEQLIPNPIDAYFIACRHGLQEEMMRAAQYSIGHKLQLEDHFVSGNLIYGLYAFRKSWTMQLLHTLSVLNLRYNNIAFWTEVHLVNRSLTTGCVHVQPWWSALLSSWITEALQSPLKINRTLLCLNLTNCKQMRSTHCSRCLAIDLKKFEEFCLDVETSASRALSSVTLRVVPDPYAFMSNNEPPRSLVDRVHPSHSRGDADVVLRSCDGVLFRTHKIILSIASPFFQDMFSLPAETVDSSQSLNVVQMTENSTTLESLLSIISPITTIVPRKFAEYSLVLAAAQKFDMSYALATLRSGASTWVERSTPCLMYGYASRLRLRDEAVSAAKDLLAYPMTIEHYDKDLSYLNAEALKLLLKYRTDCQRFLADLDGDVAHAAWWKAMGSQENQASDCISTTVSNGRSVPKWISVLAADLPEDHATMERALSPWPQIGFDNAFAKHEKACPYCKALSSELYQTMSAVLRQMASESVAFPTWD